MTYQLATGVWSWQYEQGNFEVSFVDGGEFICVDYPENSSWKGCCSECASKITVEWGKFGNYTMELQEDGKSMKGFYTGYPDDWRKGQWIRAHTAEELATIKEAAAANMNHGHQHSASCNH